MLRPGAGVGGEGMSEPKFKVGDTVIVRASYNESRYGDKQWEDQIVKVGRKYVYLKGRYYYESKTAFDATTGHQKPSQYTGNQRTIYTLADWSARQRRSEIVAALKDHGIKPGGFGYSDFTQSTEMLEKLLAVLNEVAS